MKPHGAGSPSGQKSTSVMAAMIPRLYHQARAGVPRKAASSGGRLAQQNGQDDQRGATDGGVHARGGNCRSEDEVDQGIAMELVRPVHHRVVVVLGARIASCDALPHVIFEALPQVPRIRGVQALVMV